MTDLPPKPIFGASNPALQQSHETWRPFFAWVLGVVMMLALFYVLFHWGMNQLADRVSDADEVRWFKRVEPYLLEQLKVETPWKFPAQEFMRAEGLVFTLKKDESVRKLPFTLHYSPEETPNAFAIPGGAIVVTRGLLDMVKGDIGLATVLAHELGHHQFRDPIRGVGRMLVLPVVTSLVFGQSAVFNVLTNVADASYSREQEFRADAFALELVHRRFHTTDGALEFFEKISEAHSIGDSKWTRLFSTHPYTPDRIEALKTLERRLKKNE